MARIERIVANQSLSSGARTSPQFSADQSVARGLQILGAEAEDLAERHQQKQDQFDTFRAAKDFETLAAQTDQQMLDSKMEPGGANFTTDRLVDFDANKKAYLESIPEHLRPKFEVRVERLRGRVSGIAARRELGERNRFYNEGIQDSGERIGRSVEANPDSLDESLESLDALIDESGLEPAAKEAAKENNRRLITGRAVNGLIQRGRPDEARVVAARSDRVGERFVDKVINIESSGNPNAKAKTSSALGLGQFVEDTWLGLIERQRPDLATGRTRSEILALRTNPDLSREMVGRLANENAGALSAAGLAPNNTSLYLAHFLGAGGAIAVLKAPRGTSASSVLDPESVAANKGVLKGKTVDQVIAWANRKMGGASSEATDIPEAGFNALADAEKLIAGQSRAVFDGLSLGIEEQTVTDSRLITDNELLDDGDKATLLRQLRSRKKTVLDAAQAIAEFNAGGTFYDPTSKADKRKLDHVFEAAGGQEGLLKRDDETANAAVEISRKAEVVPPAVRSTIKSQITSGDDRAKAFGLSTLDRIYRTNPEVARRDFSTSDIDKMLHFRKLISAGRSQEDALEAIRIESDPVQQQIREAREKEAMILAEEVVLTEIEDLFDETILPNAPDAPSEPAEADALINEYRTLLVDSYIKTGDEERAKERAAETIKKTWHPSMINVDDTLSPFEVPELMKHAPEKYYRTINQSHDWMKRQLLSELENHPMILEEKEKGGVFKIRPNHTARGIFADAAKVGKGNRRPTPQIPGSIAYRLIADQQTATEAHAFSIPDARSRTPVSYVVSLTRDGVTEVVSSEAGMPLRFVFDPEPAVQAFESHVRDVRRKELPKFQEHLKLINPDQQTIKLTFE